MARRFAVRIVVYPSSNPEQFVASNAYSAPHALDAVTQCRQEFGISPELVVDLVVVELS